MAAIRDYLLDYQWHFPSCLNSALKKSVVLEIEGCVLDEKNRRAGRREEGLVRDKFVASVANENVF